MKKIFGTDGIRGVANVYPMTPEMAVKVGKAVAIMFRDKNKIHRHKIVIGKDTRLSGYMLENALVAGICSMGVDVFLIGPMPTPAIAHLTRSFNADAGIVLSASHNPAIDNGIKIFSHDGYKLPDETEQQIEKLILSKKIKSDHIQGELIGKAYRINEAAGRYIEFAKASIKSMNLLGVKIVLDCANGAAYNVAPKIFSELGARMIVLNNNPDGLNINKNCGALHPETMINKVKENQANIGIALDGDADRVTMVDENGDFINGDKIMAISALYMKEKDKLKGDTVVATVMSNIGFDRAMKEAGIKVIKTKVGDRYVMEILKKEGYSLGGEQSGHIIFTDYATTGDGIVTALQILKIIKETGRKLSDLSNCMTSYPQVLLNIKVKEKKEIANMPNVQKITQEVESELGDEGRILIRYSGTEPLCRVMLEGKDQKQIEILTNKIAKEIKNNIGI